MKLRRIDYGAPYRLPPSMRMWEWAEKHITLSSRQPTMRHGRYQTALTPYVRGIFDAIADPAIERITICKGAQTGLTLLAYIAACYWVCEEPDPILLVMPSGAMAKSQSETRLQPLIEDSPHVAQELTADPDDFKKMQYVFRRCVMNLVGANSPSNLATRPVRFLILDEPDKYPLQSTREAGAVSLAIERTNTFIGFRKIISISTPTTENGYIWQQLSLSDKRQFFVTCRTCGHDFPLGFGCLKFDDGDSIRQRARSARWKCPACAAEYDDVAKHYMVDAAKWQPTQEAADPTHAGFHLPSFSSPWLTAGQAVTRWLEAQHNNAELQGVINSMFAEPWRPPPKESVALSRITELSDETPFARATIPTDQRFYVFATVDVQQNYLHAHVWAARLREHYLIDRFMLGTLDDIAQMIFATKYPNEAGAMHSVARALVDTGYDTMRVYKAALADRRIVPVKGERGSITRMTRPVQVSTIDSFPGGRLFGGRRSLSLVHLHPRYFRDALMDALNKRGDVKVGFFAGTGDDFARQMTAEVLREGEPDKFGNRETYYEKLAGRRNEDFDCAHYSFAGRHLAHSILVQLEPKPDKENTHEEENTPRKQGTAAARAPAAAAGGISINPGSVRL